MSASAILYDDALARRNAMILAIAGGLGGANASIMVATSGLLGQTFAPDPVLATMPITTFVIGTASATIPAALLMKRFGRRGGLMLGTLSGVAAGLLAAAATWLGSFILLCLAAFLAGGYAAFVQQFRFAATDTASDSFRPKAISLVLGGGIAAGVIGPQTVIHTADLFSPFTFMASYVSQAALALVSLIALAFLASPPTIERHAESLPPRPLREIARNPRFIVAILCGAVSYLTMNFVMTAAPLAMVGCGHSVTDATLAIQWHVIGMFGPSFVTGSLIARFGKIVVMSTGFLLLLSAGILGLSGLTLGHFFGTLILLGVGWNFSFIGATALLGDTHRPSESSTVQATNDFIVFAAVAVGSLSAGAAFATSGWSAVNLVVFPAAGFCLLLLLAGAYRRKA